MDTITTVAAMQAEADAARCDGRRLALIPTMGALHDGHLALVRHAREQVGPEGHVTVSIFVNPTQFGPGEDFDAYPRTLDADREALLASGAGVDAVFAPEAREMYPFGLPPLATVQVAEMGWYLCGASRPGHFDGVTSVVTRLYLACRPHLAVFGQKDAQQLAILRRMTRELGFGIEVVGHPIVREEDGLALSSRNRYLSPEERRQATVLSRALFAASHAAGQGERSADVLRSAMREQIALAPQARIDYAEIVDADTLLPADTLNPQGASGGRYLAAVAAFVGETRLIDNVTLRVGDSGRGD
ncbi:pantoate--beta-alanine ligase [Rubricoccus marinus]|uniref:Pantothenate synthetase n=1 Tax=Rubricoccus marinus TaxID=716817 RepID=A0A259TVM8_9BACT|nr:pantoate--beta-alanine ligase [Rubricoccus marinus]OZC01819.1 pantoate--beta-alanine ligase [Rubricoccus marinus]